MRTLAILLLLTLALATASCKRSEVSGDTNQNSTGATPASGAASSVPPFATKEPERYQATRVVTSSGDASGGESRTLIARDGDRRREDYEAGAGERVAYLQLPEGNYALLPAKKLYAELKTETGSNGSAHAERVPPDFSPEKLLNEARPETLYERLGEENLNGRATVKYRVTVRGKKNGPVTSESLVWVDETLGMPVKTETTSAGSKVTMELRDLKETIDAGLLELPADYKRVAPAELFAEAR